MAIKAGPWYHEFAIDWAEPGPEVSAGGGWRMRMLEGGALHFESGEFEDPPATIIRGPRSWTRVHLFPGGQMTTKSLISCECARIWLHGEQGYGPVEYRMEMLTGGVLRLREKLDPPQFSPVVMLASHAWQRVRTPSVDFLSVKGSGWCNPKVWLADNHPPGYRDPQSSSPECRMRILDGSMLLFQEEGGGKQFVIVAPHAWSAVHVAFDFTK